MARKDMMKVLLILLLLLPQNATVCLPQYDYMVNLYEESQDTSSKTKVHSFASNGRSRSKNSIIFSFESDWKIPLSQTVGARLHVQSTADLRAKMLQYDFPADTHILRVDLYSRKRRGQTREISSTIVDLRNTTSVYLDITDYMTRVMSRPTYPQPKLVLSLRTPEGAYLPAKFLINRGCTSPFLLVTTQEEGDTDMIQEIQQPIHPVVEIPPWARADNLAGADRPWVGDNRRTKRRARGWPTPLLYRDVTELEKVNYHCRRQDLWVNFDDIGWNFVIEPKRVNIGNCGGQCLDADNNIAHAVVKQLLQNLHPARNAGILCCQGAHYKEISALYFKSRHEIVIGSMPKIVVKECRCR